MSNKASNNKHGNTTTHPEFYLHVIIDPSKHSFLLGGERDCMPRIQLVAVALRRGAHSCINTLLQHSNVVLFIHYV